MGTLHNIAAYARDVITLLLMIGALTSMVKFVHCIGKYKDAIEKSGTRAFVWAFFTMLFFTLAREEIRQGEISEINRQLLAIRTAIHSR